MRYQQLCLPIEGINREIAVSSLGLPPVAFYALDRNQIYVTGDLVKRSERDLLDIRNIGRKYVADIKTAIEPLGLRLRED